MTILQSQDLLAEFHQSRIARAQQEHALSQHQDAVSANNAKRLRPAVLAQARRWGMAGTVGEVSGEKQTQ